MCFKLCIWYFWQVGWLVILSSSTASVSLDRGPRHMIYFPKAMTNTFQTSNFPKCIFPDCIFANYIFPNCIFRSEPRLAFSKLCQLILFWSPSKLQLHFFSVHFQTKTSLVWKMIVKFLEDTKILN